MTAQLLRIGDDIIAIHAVVTDEGVTLIDAGLSGDLGILRAALHGAGRALDDIRGIVLTHGDVDHIGIAEQLRAERGIPIHILAADESLATGRTTKKVKAGAWRLGPALRFVWRALRRGALRTRRPQELRLVADGDVLDLPGRPEIFAIPGHTRGSAAIRVPSVDALFLGDAITTRHVLTGEEGTRLAPFSEDPAETRRNLERLRGLPETRILPGHGPEFSGTAADLIDALDARG